MPPKDADALLAGQQHILKVLNREIEGMDVQYNTLATTIEKAMGKGRMSEPALLAVKDNSKTPAKVQQDSISLGVLAKSLAKKRAIVERKEQLIHTLTLFIQEDQGVLRAGYTTAYYNTIMSKRGGLTEKERTDKFIFGCTEAPSVAPIPAHYEGGGGGGGASSAAAAAAAGPISYSGGKSKREDDAPLTKTGEPDKRFKAGTK